MIISLGGTKKNAVVDAEDYPIVSRYSWHLDAKGYAVTGMCGTTVRMHRFILNPSKHDQVDHKNLDRLDNRKENLRVCNNALNQANVKKRKGNTSSIYKGVHWRKDLNKWAARVSNMGKRFYLGYFDDEKEAAKAYNAKALEIWGDFARLNEVD